MAQELHVCYLFSCTDGREHISVSDLRESLNCHVSFFLILSVSLCMCNPSEQNAAESKDLKLDTALT